MTCHDVDRMLGDYLDGSLSAADRAALEAHAASCDACRALVSGVSDLTSRAHALPDLAPERDLWPEIAARLETPVVELGTHQRAAPARPHDRSRFLTPAWLAAAAAVLVAVTATLSVVATRALTPRASGTPAATAPTVAAANPPSDSNGRVASSPEEPAQTPAPAPEVRNASAHRPVQVSVDAIYAREIAQLDAIVHDRRSQLDSSTIAVIEKNLRIIDHAIAQSRAALARDPNSRFLHEQLNDALDQKVSLLRTAAFLPAHT